ncbi:MAG: acetyl-CoA C-acyltransferase [Propionibacteriales bacterium]|nr:acetyl-CoA C-acyltransferase [Propionibacteriales bacterium]
MNHDNAEDVVLVSAARTPFGKFGGALRSFSIPDLAGLAGHEVLRRAGVDPGDAEEFALGVNLPGSDRSLARQGLLRAGIPDDRNAYTVDRACCSSLTAITMVSRSIRLGEITVGLAGGAENLSRVPYYVEDMRWGRPLGDVVLKDQLVISCPHTHAPRAVQASDEALAFGVTRSEQDAWALRSQQRYAAAEAAGRLAEERFPITLDDGVRLTTDESPRSETSIEKLASLPTVYGSETVTAGNAPALSTGASAVVLMSHAEARRRELSPLATVLATAMASGHPAGIASIPAAAALAVLRKAGLTLADVDLIEVNEAFAAVPLVTTLVLAGKDVRAADLLREKVNVNGGAIAVGHPTGATGARLVMALTNELRRRGGGLGLVTICGGIGEAEALLIRVS